jgi:hypothetical protein
MTHNLQKISKLTTSYTKFKIYLILPKNKEKLCLNKKSPLTPKLQTSSTKIRKLMPYG